MAHLSLGRRLGFGIFGLGENFAVCFMNFWAFRYLSAAEDLPPVWVFAVLMAGRLWGAAAAPVAGHVSDRTLSRRGRRRPYLLFGTIPLFLSLGFFFMGPVFTGFRLNLVRIAAAVLVFNTALALIAVPYSALTPELSASYHEKTSLNGFRFTFAQAGTLLGILAVEPALRWFSSIPFLPGAGWLLTGLVAGAFASLTVLAVFFAVREKDLSRNAFPGPGFFSGCRETFSNRPYVRLLGAYTFQITGLTLFQILLGRCAEYAYRLPCPGFIAPLALFLPALVFTPVSVLVSRRAGKKRTCQLCFLILAASSVFSLFLGFFGVPVFLGLLACTGMGMGFGYALPYSMIADTVEFDAVKSEERKEGIYYGVWALVSSLGVSLAFFLAGLVPGLAPGTRLVMGSVPALMFAAAALCIRRYSLGENTYRKIMGAGLS
ncbi:MAG: MFS transporter [Treponema sp.]|jgi:GPH family glycoside/pentoside/hexuronide:cation symporter|nr:MFS transporter [Treponema sp.]